MFRFFLSLLLLPLCAAVFCATTDVLRAASATDDLFSAPVFAFAGGYLAWLLVYFCFKAPMKTYVFGHEMTHALWGLLFGARVGRLRVTEKGGSVMLSKSNLLISLAPYFFPFYTMLVVAVYLLGECFWNMTRLWPVFLFLVAFTWSFHVTFTIISLRVRQPDIMEHGRLFSWVIIWLVNIAEVGLWIVAATPVKLSLYWANLCGHTETLYTGVWRIAVAGCVMLSTWIRQFL